MHGVKTKGKPEISLAPTQIYGKTTKERARAQVNEAKNTALTLVEQLDYHELGSGPLAKLGLESSAPTGLNIQAARLNTDGSECGANIAWKIWFILPGTMAEDISSYLISGTLRSQPSSSKFLQVPGMTEMVEKIDRIRYGSGCAAVLYSLHRYVPGNHQDKSLCFSQLRIVFSTTTSDGRTMVVEAPATHSARTEHDGDLLFMSNKAAHEAALSSGIKSIPRSFFTAYVVEQNRNGTLVTAHIASCGPKVCLSIGGLESYGSESDNAGSYFELSIFFFGGGEIKMPNS